VYKEICVWYIIRMISIDEINSSKLYAPIGHEQEFCDRIDRENIIRAEKFAVSSIFNFYNIRSSVLQPYYDEAKQNPWRESRASVRYSLTTIGGMKTGGGYTWSQFIDKFIDDKETVQDFWDKYSKSTDNPVFTPYKTWKKKTIHAFIYYFLDELDFYSTKRAKKDFFSILLNYYIQEKINENPQNIIWDNFFQSHIKKLTPYSKEWCELTGDEYKGYVPKK